MNTILITGVTGFLGSHIAEELINHGFKIVASSYDTIEFIIDNQLSRKLKLLKLDNKIKYNSIEDRLIKLIDSSDDKSNDNTNNIWLSDYFRENDYYYVNNIDYNDYSNYNQERYDRKNILNQHSNKFKQKLKQYK